MIHDKKKVNQMEKIIIPYEFQRKRKWELIDAQQRIRGIKEVMNKINKGDE